MVYVLLSSTTLAIRLTVVRKGLSSTEANLAQSTDSENESTEPGPTLTVFCALCKTDALAALLPYLKKLFSFLNGRPIPILS